LQDLECVYCVFVRIYNNCIYIYICVCVSVEMINENRNVSEESSIMQRSYTDVAKGSGMSDTKQ